MRISAIALSYFTQSWPVKVRRGRRRSPGWKTCMTTAFAGDYINMRMYEVHQLPVSGKEFIFDNFFSRNMNGVMRIGAKYYGVMTQIDVERCFVQ